MVRRLVCTQAAGVRLPEDPRAPRRRRLNRSLTLVNPPGSERGQAIETVAPAEFDRWRSLLQAVTEEWVKKADQKGYAGRKLIDDLEAMIKAASS